MSTTTCPFCDKTQSYRYIAETESMLAIYPKAPACSYHVLITPKRHIAYLDSLSNDEVIEMYGLMRHLVDVTKQNVPDFIGYNVLSNNGGSKVRQQVMHCHVHLFLRTASDTRDPLAPRHNASPPDLTEEDLGNLTKLRQWIGPKLLHEE